MSNALKLFICYSRRDTVAADALVKELESAGFEVTIDRRDLPYGEKWQAEISDFIRLSDTVVWLISPASIGSDWCNWELGEVQRRRKRLVPIKIAEFVPGTLPKALGEIHFLPSVGIYAPEQHLNALVAALETDRAWLKEQSALAERADEWIARGCGSDRLLRGQALRDANLWRSRQPSKAPPPSESILDLLAASERGAKHRQRFWLVGLSAVVVSIGVLAIVAFLQRNEALLTESHFLAGFAQELRKAGNVSDAIALAARALPQSRSLFRRAVC
jgi:hypothetical protein